MSFEYTLKQYINNLNNYMKSFGLYSIDVSYLIGSTRDIIKDLGDSKSGPTLKTLVAIAAIFNRSYFELGNPEFPLPELHELPKDTMERINFRKKIGPAKNKENRKLNLNEKILEALKKVRNTEKFLASEVYHLLDEDTRNELGHSNRITSLFSTELAYCITKLNEQYKIKGRIGRPEEYYKLIKKPNGLKG